MIKNITILLFALLFFSYTYIHQKRFDGPTSVSRLDLLHSIVKHRTFSIDAYHHNTPDKAVYERRYYSDKAPGTVALAFPPFLLSVIILTILGIDLDSKTGWLFSSWMACAGSIAIITAAGGCALFNWLSRYVAPRYALITTVAIFIGAAPLPYSTWMFSHSLVVGLITISLWAIEQENNKMETVNTIASQVETQQSTTQNKISWIKNNKWDLLAGFACGLAIASEYSSGLIIIGIFIWLFTIKKRRVIPFCIGIIPPLLLIPLYSYLCFGNPFTLPYSHQASFPAMREGLFAIKLPNIVTAYNLTFSACRGLFFWTPFLLIAFVGYYYLLNKSVSLFWLTYAVPVLQIIVISGRVWDWQAGPTLGPRLLAPLLPLIALPCAYGTQKLPRIGILLAILSIGLTSLGTVTNACCPGEITNPLVEIHLKALAKGDFSPNLGMVIGLPSYLSIALYYIVIFGGILYLWFKLPDKTDLKSINNCNIQEQEEQKINE